MLTNNLNPILFNWGIITIRWYGLFLAIGVVLAVWIIYKLFKQKNLSGELALDLCVWLIIGGLLGARLGEILFYEPAYYFSNPLEMIMINHGGLSSHGMTIGLLITFFLFLRFRSPLGKGGAEGLLDWKKIIDIIIIPIPLLAAFIRIGNFFNSEIIGRPTTLPWGVKFPLTDPSLLTRHPVQLYESIIALSLFFILYSLFKKLSDKTPKLFFFHLFLLTYFSTRFLLEFTKEYQTSWENFFTAGQWLSLPFIVWGMIYFARFKRKNKLKSNNF